MNGSYACKIKSDFCTVSEFHRNHPRRKIASEIIVQNRQFMQHYESAVVVVPNVDMQWRQLSRRYSEVLVTWAAYIIFWRKSGKNMKFIVVNFCCLDTKAGVQWQTPFWKIPTANDSTMQENSIWPCIWPVFLLCARLPDPQEIMAATSRSLDFLKSQVSTFGARTVFLLVSLLCFSEAVFVC